MREELIFRLEEEDRELAAKIRVIGLGGGGGNAVNRMISSRFTGVEFIAVANTDVQALSRPRRRSRSSSATKLTKRPRRRRRSRGRPQRAARRTGSICRDPDRRGHGLHHRRHGRRHRHGRRAGGGAQIARELGALTVGVVTKPFQFEGQRRMRQADDGIAASSGPSSTR